ncbi:MAG: PPC domain-containing DNA-binding protein [Bacillota bacterium]|jgi:predicted DNA-binding protein with PD1-like motif
MIRQFDAGHIFQLPLQRNQDLLQELDKALDNLLVDSGTVQFIGALYQARVGCFNPETGEYEVTEVNEFAEIASGMGTISQKDGQPVAHVHVVLAGASGRIYAGHLMPGSRIFVTEMTIFDLDGIPQQRKLDPETGLYLWQE